jgi:hypothetical protein
MDDHALEMNLNEAPMMHNDW